MYDTCLFSLGGKSVGLQSGGNVFDLSPVIMGIVYIILLTINIVSVFIKKDFILTSISNLILSIPVILVLKVFVVSYPPFGNTEFFVSSIFQLLLYCYLSAVLFIVFLTFCFISLCKRFRRKNDKIASNLT